MHKADFSTLIFKKERNIARISDSVVFGLRGGQRGHPNPQPWSRTCSKPCFFQRSQEAGSTSEGNGHFFICPNHIEYEYLILMLFNYCITLLRFRNNVLKKKKNFFNFCIFFCIGSSWDIRGFIW